MRHTPLIAVVLSLGLAAGLAFAQTTRPASRPATQPARGNPPAPGFDEAGSGRRAVAIADLVMMAMGGREPWDETR